MDAGGRFASAKDVTVDSMTQRKKGSNFLLMIRTNCPSANDRRLFARYFLFTGSNKQSHCHIVTFGNQDSAEVTGIRNLESVAWKPSELSDHVAFSLMHAIVSLRHRIPHIPFLLWS